MRKKNNLILIPIFLLLIYMIHYVLNEKKNYELSRNGYITFGKFLNCEKPLNQNYIIEYSFSTKKDKFLKGDISVKNISIEKFNKLKQQQILVPVVVSKSKSSINKILIKKSDFESVGLKIPDSLTYLCNFLEMDCEN